MFRRNLLPPSLGQDEQTKRARPVDDTGRVGGKLRGPMAAVLLSVRDSKNTKEAKKRVTHWSLEGRYSSPVLSDIIKKPMSHLSILFTIICETKIIFLIGIVGGGVQ
jgi:hypothetical protein